MKKGKKTAIITTASILCISVAIYIPIRTTGLFDRLIAKEVNVQGESVGFVPKTYTEESLEKKFNAQLQSKKITLKYGNLSITKTYGDLNVKYNFDSAVESAFSYGKDGKNIINRTINKNIPERHEILLGIIYDKNSAAPYITSISAQIDRNPVDARLSFKDGKFVFTKEAYGRRVDKEKLGELINDAIINGKEIVEIPVTAVQPKATEAILSKSTQKIASFTTRYTKVPNRVNNIKLAAGYINGTVLMPGDIFSANKTIGQRTVERGFKEAGVYVNGKVDTGVGGGICQVSTTIYNAALLGNFKIIERYNHSMPVSYVKPGRDATINWGGADFKFKNSSNYPLYIQVIANESQITVNFYSYNENPGQKVELSTETIQEDGKTKYKTYRRIFRGDKLVTSELLSKDFYLPHP